MTSGVKYRNDYYFCDTLPVSSAFDVAEGTGFEPVPPLRENGFRNRRFGPLSQPSNRNGRQSK